MRTAIKSRVCWNEIKEDIKTINPSFYDLINDINPSNDLGISLVKYPYGMTIADTKNLFIPDHNGQLKSAGTDNKSPLCMVFEKNLELYLHSHSRHFPMKILQPGDIIPLSPQVEYDPFRRFIPENICMLSSGIRDIALLSLNGHTDTYEKLIENYDIPRTLSPKNPYDHFSITNTILNKENVDWYSSLLIFDPIWYESIYSNPKWHKVKEYLLEKFILNSSCRRRIHHLDWAVLDAIEKNNIKLTRFAHEMIKQIILVTVGETPGYIPITTENSMPLSALTRILTNIPRELLTYPIIMGASMSDLQSPIYHSISFTTSAENASKTTPDSIHLNQIEKAFEPILQELKVSPQTKGTIYSNLGDLFTFEAFTERGSPSGKIKAIDDALKKDKRFLYAEKSAKYDARYGNPTRSSFLKAFMGIYAK